MSVDRVKPWSRLRDKAVAPLVVEGRRVDSLEGRDAGLLYLASIGMGGHESNNYRSAHRILDYETFKYIDCIPKESPLWKEQRRLEDADIKRRAEARKNLPELLERSGGKCEWCFSPVVGRDATIDHIDPNAGNEIANLAVLCRRCNSSKNDGDFDRLTRIWKKHHVTNKVEDILSPIVGSLIWADTQEATCPWCAGDTKNVGSLDFSFVWRCKPCSRYFTVDANNDGLCDFRRSLNYAIRGGWFARDEERGLIHAIMNEAPTETVRNLLRSFAGDIVELKRKRHTHSGPGSCWCEYGDDGWKALGHYAQDCI